MDKNNVVVLIVLISLVGGTPFATELRPKRTTSGHGGRGPGPQGQGGAHHEPDNVNIKMCIAPRKPENVAFTASTNWNHVDYWPGTELHFYCTKATMRLVGQPTMFCAKNGNWQPSSVPRCYESINEEKSCPELTLSNGSWKCASNSPCTKRQAGSSVQIDCNKGYYLAVDNKIVTCLADGRWSPEVPQCVNQRCSTLTAVHNGTFKCITSDCLDFKPGAMLDVVCDAGYRLLGQATLTCEPEHTWSHPLPRCIPLLDNRSCGPPYKIQHGRWTMFAEYEKKFALFGYGTSILYRCDTGYKMIGLGRLKCMSDGHWFPYPPKCQPEVLCMDPGKVDNGRYQCSETTPACIDYSVGSMLVFICDEGYKTEGSHKITCNNTGRWSSPEPLCTKISSTAAPLSRSRHPLASTTTVVIITACGVLGLLMVVMLVVAIQKRRPSARLCHSVTPPPPPYSPTQPPVTPESIEENDRVALIAYDGISLPSYEEAVMAHHTQRPRHNIMTSSRQSDGISRHSILTNSTANRDGISAFGSLDTVNMSTDGTTSTSVTVDTYDSGASRRALAGSLASTSDSNSLHKQEWSQDQFAHQPQNNNNSNNTTTTESPSIGNVGTTSSQDVELEEMKDD